MGKEDESAGRLAEAQEELIVLVTLAITPIVKKYGPVPTLLAMSSNVGTGLAAGHEAGFVSPSLIESTLAGIRRLAFTSREEYEANKNPFGRAN